MKPQNIECAGADGICVICALGEELKDNEPCQYDAMRGEDECPGFECAEQCRLCPEDCEFYGKPKMTLNEYQEFAARTMKPRRDLTDDLSDYILGLVGEAGELANTAKKMLFHGHDWDERQLSGIRHTALQRLCFLRRVWLRMDAPVLRL